MLNGKENANEQVADSVPATPEPLPTTGNSSESGAASAKDVLEPALEIERWQARDDAARRLVRKMHLPRPNRRPEATGPRTKNGKEKSRYNAFKHGIFSRALVTAPGESMVHFELLLHGFSEYFQPQGAVEELLVEKLAVLAWRYRRLLAAETAEIQHAIRTLPYQNPSKLDMKTTMEMNTDGYLPTSLRRSSITGIKICILILKELRQKIQEEGLNWERDLSTLMEIYGRGPEYKVYESPHTHKKELLRIEPEPLGLLAKRYRDLTLGEKLRSEATTPIDSSSDRAKLILELIAKELRLYEETLEHMLKEVEPKITYQMESTVVPPQEAIERLQRYEVGLDRAFDRTLSQLERLKRMRLGQPVAPRIQVDVSH